ncbi:MAG: hypothetical protein M3Z21_03200 [Pseudomonadota bacterium]|nr:hypothetical protein [Pseudomonadota bacterium]
MAEIVRRQAQDLEQQSAQKAQALERAAHAAEVAICTPAWLREQARAEVGGKRLAAAQEAQTQAAQRAADAGGALKWHKADQKQAGLGKRWNPWSSLNRDGQTLKREHRAALAQQEKARQELAAVNTWLEEPAQRQAVETCYGDLLEAARRLQEQLPAKRQAIKAERAEAALLRERERDLRTLGNRPVAVDRQRGEDGRERLAVDWGEVKRQAEQVRQQLQQQRALGRVSGRDRGGPER